MEHDADGRSEQQEGPGGVPVEAYADAVPFLAAELDPEQPRGVRIGHRVLVRVVIGVRAAVQDRIRLEETARGRLVEPYTHQQLAGGGLRGAQSGAVPAVAGGGARRGRTEFVVLPHLRRGRPAQRERDRDVAVQIGEGQHGVAGARGEGAEFTARGRDIAQYGSGCRVLHGPARVVAVVAVVVDPGSGAPDTFVAARRRGSPRRYGRARRPPEAAAAVRSPWPTASRRSLATSAHFPGIQRTHRVRSCSGARQTYGRSPRSIRSHAALSSVSSSGRTEALSACSRTSSDRR